MRKLVVLLAVLLALSGGLTAAAGPTPGGVTSDNVEWVQHIPFEVGTATGARVIGKYLYVTSWKSFSIYDVSDPQQPQRLSTTPFGFKFENEDVATNGKIMLFSEQLPQDILHVWDVEDKTNPVQIAELPGGGGHTSSCLFRCKWSYSSTGVTVDLRNPTEPKLAGSWSQEEGATSAHDVIEVAPGLVLTASRPMMLLDARKDPANPELIAIGDNREGPGIHSINWANKMKDRFFLAASETNARPRCEDVPSPVAPFMTWDASNWKKTKTFTLIDEYRVTNGTASDGRPIVNALGCSSHWFQEHPDYRNGGLVAAAFYEHGTRFLDISSAGQIEEIGYFMPWAGSTSAAYWLNDEVVYAVDYSRGIDVLRFKDD